MHSHRSLQSCYDYPATDPLVPVPRRVQPEGPHREADLLDSDGLPHVGAAIWPGQYYYNTVDRLTGGELWQGQGRSAAQRGGR